LNISISPEKLSPGDECVIEIDTVANAIVTLSFVEDQKLVESFNDEVFKLAKPVDDENFRNLFFIYEDLRVQGDDEDCERERTVRSVANDDEDIVPGKPVNNFRTKSHEPWIFESFKANSEGKLRFKSVIPNKVTVWKLYGLSSHPKHGLASSITQEIKFSKEIFMKIDLSSKVRLFEHTNVHVTVFNHLDDSINVEIGLIGNDDSDEFEVFEVTSECFLIHQDKNYTKLVSIPPRSHSTVSFNIQPVKSGLLNINFAASNHSEVLEEVSEVLNVLPDIYNQYKSYQYFANLNNMEKIAYQLNLYVPDEVIPETIQIEANVGNMLDPLVKDAEYLLTS
jgi:hypothetical protein